MGKMGCIRRVNVLLHRGGVILLGFIIGCALAGCGRVAIESRNAIALPDAADSPKGTGFTCTGLTFDATNNEWLVGNVGQELPTEGKMRSTIVRLSADFSSVLGARRVSRYERHSGALRGW